MKSNTKAVIQIVIVIRPIKIRAIVYTIAMPKARAIGAMIVITINVCGNIKNSKRTIKRKPMSKENLIPNGCSAIFCLPLSNTSVPTINNKSPLFNDRTVLLSSRPC